MRNFDTAGSGPAQTRVAMMSSRSSSESWPRLSARALTSCRPAQPHTDTPACCNVPASARHVSRPSGLPRASAVGIAPSTVHAGAGRSVAVWNRHEKRVRVHGWARMFYETHSTPRAPRRQKPRTARTNAATRARARSATRETMVFLRSQTGTQRALPGAAHTSAHSGRVLLHRRTS